MSCLRELVFVCAEGHEYRDLRSFENAASIPTSHKDECKCGAQAVSFNIMPGHAPALSGQSQRSRRSGGITEGEAIQAKVQFGVTPTTRDELNALLKQHGKIAVGDSEFNTLMEHADAVQEQQKKDPYTAAQKEQRRDAAMKFARDRRTWFRSQYDHGNIPKSPSVDSEVAKAKAAVASDPLN